MEKIPVATAVTAYYYTLSGTTVLLVFNKTLWFVSIMVKSFIATNRVCSHGIQLSDDPYDQNRPLGIVDNDSYWYIPFTVKKSVSGVETREPTIEEYNDCPNIIYMTSDNRWNP